MHDEGLASRVAKRQKTRGRPSGPKPPRYSPWLRSVKSSVGIEILAVFWQDASTPQSRDLGQIVNNMRQRHPESWLYLKHQ